MKRDKLDHTVPSNLAQSMRLRSYLVGIFPILKTASAAKKAIKKGQIEVDGLIGNTGDWISAGMVITYLPPLRQTVVGTFDIPIVYEDDDLLIVNKPGGMTSSDLSARSLQSQLKKVDAVVAPDALPYPYLVHRLDRATSGLMVAARTMTCRRLLGEMLDRQEMTKTYVAIVEGDACAIPRTIDLPILEKAAKTEILSIEPTTTADHTSMLYIRLHTGRTHQIRKHLASVGFPIVGDKLYNAEGLDFGRGLFLMCSHLEFTHPVSNTLVTVTAELHKKFAKYLPKLSKR